MQFDGSPSFKGVFLDLGKRCSFNQKHLFGNSLKHSTQETNIISRIHDHFRKTTEKLSVFPGKNISKNAAYKLQAIKTVKVD